jgi:hypothetical protein
MQGPTRLLFNIRKTSDRVGLAVIIGCSIGLFLFFGVDAPDKLPAYADNPIPVVHTRSPLAYLPSAADLPPGYIPEDTPTMQMILGLMTPLRRYVGVQGYQRAEGDNLPGHILYILYVLSGPTSNSSTYDISQYDNFVYDSFYLVMPPESFYHLRAIDALHLNLEACDSLLVKRAYSSLPGDSSAYIAANCRVKNLIILFWSQTKSAPDEELSQQVEPFLQLVLQKLK